MTFTIYSYVDKKMKNSDALLPIGVESIEVQESGRTTITLSYLLSKDVLSTLQGFYGCYIIKDSSSDKYLVGKGKKIFMSIEDSQKITINPESELSFKTFPPKRIEKANLSFLHLVDSVRKDSLPAEKYLEEISVFLMHDEKILNSFVNSSGENYLSGIGNILGTTSTLIGLLSILSESFPNTRIDYNYDDDSLQVRYRNRFEQKTGIYLYRGRKIIDGYELTFNKEKDGPLFHKFYFSHFSIFGGSVDSKRVKRAEEAESVSQNVIDRKKLQDEIRDIEEKIKKDEDVDSKPKGLSDDLKGEIDEIEKELKDPLSKT